MNALLAPEPLPVALSAEKTAMLARLAEGLAPEALYWVAAGSAARAGAAQRGLRLAEAIGFVPSGQLRAAAEQVIAIQRDWGDRAERKHARLKYTLDKRGTAAFTAELERRLDFSLQPARPYRFEHNGDRYGWLQGDDGRWHLTLHIESGRLLDRGERRLFTGMRELARVHTGDFRLTCNQNVIVANVEAADRPRIDAIVAAHGLDGYRRQSAIRPRAIACVALPTCGLAMAESERYLPTILDKLEAQLARHGLLDAPILLRLSGCPNGCSRPYLGEIALVGRAPGRYDLRLGADFVGQRLNRGYRENVDEAAILDPLFARYAAERSTGEGFGDFLLRTGLLPPAPRRIPTEVTA